MKKYIIYAMMSLLTPIAIVSISVAQAHEPATFPNSVAEVDIRMPDGTTMTHTATGPSDVHTNLGDAGEAQDTNDNGLDQIDTELVAMDLQGNNFSVQLDPAQTSTGETEEQTNDTSEVLDLNPFGNQGQADSFFDVFVLVEIDETIYHHTQPVHLIGVLSSHPAGEDDMYVSNQEHPLLNADNTPSDLVITRVKWTPLPIPQASPTPDPSPSPAPFALDHFKCYWLRNNDPIQDIVLLRDQFDILRQTHDQGIVKDRNWFCNPTRKIHGFNSVGISNPDNHLTWYDLDRVAKQDVEPIRVEVKNQFSPNGQELEVRQLSHLAVPTHKIQVNGADTGHNAPDDLDHFKCYRVRAKKVKAEVKLQDQFDIQDNKVIETVAIRPKFICNPTFKAHLTGLSANGEIEVENADIKHPQDHLVCYNLEKVRATRRKVGLHNQFGDQELETRRATLLCAPSEKQLLDVGNQ